MNRTVQIVLIVLAFIIVAGGSFYGGTVYGRRQVQTLLVPTGQQNTGALFGQGGTGFVPNQTGQAGAGRRAAGQGGAAGQFPGGMLAGQITEVHAGVLVVTDANGKQTQVRVTDTTLIEKNSSVTLADLKQGETVIVSGTQDADGSITARSVQVGLAGRFMGGQPPQGQPTGQ